MLDRLRSLLTGDPAKRGADRAVSRESPPGQVTVEGLAPFALTQHITRYNGFPIVDWNAVASWVEGAPAEPVRNAAWTACERAWLLHLRDALGESYGLSESNGAALLSSLEPNLRRAVLDYMDRTLVRVTKVLDGIAQVPPQGKDILIVFDDADSYYNYVSFYYPEEGGEFAYSGGMHISSGCGHFVTIKADLRSVEPVIVHEMTHGCLSHLPLPAWLDEGLAVNTERHIAGRDYSPHTPAEMRAKHLSFWGEDEIQQFWSGESFYRPDDGNLLSYDLARILVEHMARDWERFRQFVLDADRRDAGTRAAEKHLGIDLGEAVCSLFERPQRCRWAPDPGKWKEGRDGVAGQRGSPSRPVWEKTRVRRETF